MLVRKKARLWETLDLMGERRVVVRGGLGICIFKGLQVVLMVTHVWDPLGIPQSVSCEWLIKEPRF